MRNFKVVIVVGCFGFIFSGCMAKYEAGLKSETAASIGCPPNEISLHSRKYQFTHQSWVAECRGSRYFCRQSTIEPFALNCAKEQKQ